MNDTLAQQIKTDMHPTLRQVAGDCFQGCTMTNKHVEFQAKIFLLKLGAPYGKGMLVVIVFTHECGNPHRTNASVRHDAK